MQSLESSLFVVDESAAAVSGIKSGGLHAAYPREKPSRAELIKWLEGGREYLGTIGYGPFLRKEDPYDLAKLAPISLETVSAAADAETKAAVATENRRITRDGSGVSLGAAGGMLRNKAPCAPLALAPQARASGSQGWGIAASERRRIQDVQLSAMHALPPTSTELWRRPQLALLTHHVVLPLVQTRDFGR